jgi:signal recognition particle GTPase
MFKMPDQLDTVLRLCESDEDAEALAYGAVSDPLKYWCPHGGQERMIKSVAEAIERSKISVILATSANGWGKTTTTVNLLLNFVYGAQNGWFDYE